MEGPPRGGASLLSTSSGAKRRQEGGLRFLGNYLLEPQKRELCKELCLSFPTSELVDALHPGHLGQHPKSSGVQEPWPSGDLEPASHHKIGAGRGEALWAGWEEWGLIGTWHGSNPTAHSHRDQSLPL